MIPPAFRLSIGANLLLAGAVAMLLLREPRATCNHVIAELNRDSARSETSVFPRGAAEVESSSHQARLMPATIALLKKQGVSHEILFNLVLENLNHRSAQRVADLQKRYAPRLVPDREFIELSRQSDAERIRELKEVFGEEGYRTWDKEQTLRSLNRARGLGDELAMSAAEAEQAYRLQKEFDERNRELQMAMEDGVADMADIGTLQAQAQQALDRELEKLLGKQRFDELRGNTDPTVEIYRTYGELNPTPEQAKAVVQAEAERRAHEAALAERVKLNPMDTANLTADLKAMRESQEENLRRIFGAEAYDKIKRQNDPTYKTLNQYAEAWELKDREVQSVYQALTALYDQTDLTRTAAEMREAAGQRVNWREINSAIDQTRQQTEAGLQNLIGSERLRRLKQNGVLTSR